MGANNTILVCDWDKLFKFTTNGDLMAELTERVGAQERFVRPARPPACLLSACRTGVAANKEHAGKFSRLLAGMHMREAFAA